MIIVSYLLKGDVPLSIMQANKSGTGFSACVFNSKETANKAFIFCECTEYLLFHKLLLREKVEQNMLWVLVKTT